MISVAIVGLGYFSRLHQDAWAGHPDARIVGVTDLDPRLTDDTAHRLGVPGFSGLSQLLTTTDPDVIDIVAPPPAHSALIRQALKPGRTIICQKPFCMSLTEATQVVADAESAQTRVIVHENFRFQPWYRDIKAFLDAGRMGAVYQCRFLLRPGDGRGPDAYLARQPAFQTMSRLLIHETGVHFIDLFRWLFGDIASVYADLRHLNPAIIGEDAGTVILSHVTGVQSVFDGNRLADIPARNPRLTMGELVMEGEAGTLHLDGDGRLTFRGFGEKAARSMAVTAPRQLDVFGGGCVAALIAHVLDCLKTGTAPENIARDYLPVIHASDAAYRSHRERRRIDLEN
jgi:predicted dehydrogenase